MSAEDVKAAAKAVTIAAMKASMMPQIDAALSGWIDMLSQTMETASAAEIDRCAGIVESCAKPPGSVGAGDWNRAINFAADRLREWKNATTETPNGRKEGAPDV